MTPARTTGAPGQGRPTSSGRTARPFGEESRTPRLDLQGVRGLGVSLVVIGHLFIWPSGVFAALDMFFVLSGYLITGILVGSLDRFGPSVFPAFYLSRARRLMPMAVVVLVFTVVATYLAYSGARARLVGIDALWAFAFAVNWHFIAVGTDYFALHTASPLQHYWSLSVEEQFYVVWPMLVLVAIMLSRRVRSDRARITVIAAVLGSVAAASFGYSMWHSATAPVASYFSTFDRAWEFALGGLLALAANRLARLPRAVKMACSWIGVVGILVTVFVMDTSLAFPAPWGLVPVLMTSMVIVGGLACDTRHMVVLRNPVMVYIGNISYSVYLWHMPLQVVLVPYFGGRTIPYFVTSLLATAVFSVLGHHTIEKPLRKARWLMTRAEKARMRPSPMLEPRVGRILKVTHGYLVVGSLLALIYVAVVVARSGVLAPAAADPPAAEVVAQQARLTAALDVTSFPAFSPSLDQMAATTWETEHAKVACIDVDPADLPACRFGPADAEHTVVVAGDSFGVAWMPAILDAFVPRGWAVQQMTLTQCPTWTLPTYEKRDQTAFPECSAIHDAVDQYVTTQKPDLLILASSYDQVLNAESSGSSSAGVDLARTGLGATLTAVKGRGTQVAVLQPPPPHESLLDCVSRAGRPRDCVSEPNEFWDDHVKGEEEAVTAAGAGVSYVPTIDWFCVDNRCPGFVGSTPVTVEGVHLTVEFSQQLSALLAKAMPELAPEVAADPATTDPATTDPATTEPGATDPAVSPSDPAPNGP